MRVSTHEDISKIGGLRFGFYLSVLPKSTTEAVCITTSGGGCRAEATWEGTRMSPTMEERAGGVLLLLLLLLLMADATAAPAPPAPLSTSSASAAAAASHSNEFKRTNGFKSKATMEDMG